MKSSKDEAYENLREQVEKLVGDMGDTELDTLCQWISDRLDDANQQGYQEGVQETKQQMSMAATVSGLWKEYEKIEKTSHEL